MELLRRHGARLAGVVGGAAVAAGGWARVGGALVLGYHDVVDDASTAVHLSVSTGRLRAQLQAVLGAGLRVVELSALAERLAQRAPVDGLAAVTFDDGLVGVHRRALPVLVDLGLPATAFVVTDHLGTDAPWWPGASRTMTRGELADLAEAGVRIASHTCTHASLPALDDRRLRTELERSRAAVAELPGADLASFAYPFGHFDRRVRAAVEEAGYATAFSFRNGRIMPGADPRRLPRLTMFEGQHRARFAYHLARPAASWPEPVPEEATG